MTLISWFDSNVRELRSVLAIHRRCFNHLCPVLGITVVLFVLATIPSSCRCDEAVLQREEEYFLSEAIQGAFNFGSGAIQGPRAATGCTVSNS
jgi:hypothetical protein